MRSERLLDGSLEEVEDVGVALAELIGRDGECAEPDLDFGRVGPKEDRSAEEVAEDGEKEAPVRRRRGRAVKSEEWDERVLEVLSYCSRGVSL